MFSAKKLLMSAALNYEGSSSSSSLGVFEQLGSDIDGVNPGDRCGFSVSLSSDGTTLAVGSPHSNGDSGHVRIFSRNGSEWTQKGETILGGSSGDLGGWSVSLDADGDTVAVGYPRNDLGGSNSGLVRAYRWINSAWVSLGQELQGERAGDQYGYSVDISDDGNAVAIGATYSDDNGSNSGHVRVHEWSGSSWVQTGSDIAGDASGDLSGHSVSGDANTVAIGSIFNDVSGSNSGSVSVYQRVGSSWAKRGLEIRGEMAGDQSVFAVSMSGDGNVVAIGAPFNDGSGNNSGHVRVYEWFGSDWRQRGGDIDGERADDGSGYSVSLNGDGSIVAIGAIYNDDGGTNAGHVRIHRWDGSAWMQIGKDIDGEMAGDNSGSGRSVSMSSDGSIVAIGAQYNDGNGSDAGHVRVYRLI